MDLKNIPSILSPAMLMQKTDRDKDLEIPVWDEYKKIITKHDERGENAVGAYECFEFYEQAKLTF